MNYGQIIKQAVVNKGLTQSEYAKKMNLTLSGVAKIFERKHLNTEIIHKTAEICGVSVEKMYGFSSTILTDSQLEHNQSVVQSAVSDNTYQYANVISKKTDSIECKHKVELLSTELRAKDREIDLLNKIIEMQK